MLKPLSYLQSCGWTLQYVFKPVAPNVLQPTILLAELRLDFQTQKACQAMALAAKPKVC